MKTILLKLSGPLQSWGTDSNFETRHTDYHPSKSAIIGMIAGAMGLRRDQDAEIQKLNDLDFAVRVDQKGNLLKDYQIARKYKSNGSVDQTYVTERYYLEDAVFVVGICSEDDDLINKVEDALSSPYFQPFMGRRSCPPPADFIIGTTDKTILDSLSELGWQASEYFQKRNLHIKKLAIYADADLLEGVPTKMRRDRVVSFDQKSRKFGFRAEARVEVDCIPTIKQNDHDAFAAIGG